MTATTPAQVKGLFFHLVKSVGGVEAAATYLGISHQRVSQFQSLNCADMPSLMQVVTLEAVSQPIVTSALAKAANAAAGVKDLLGEVCDVTETAAQLQALIRNGASQREITELIVKLQREASEVPAANDRSAA